MKFKYAPLLKQSRLNAGLTRGQVAEKVGCEENAIYLYETSRREPQASTWIELCRVLKIFDKKIRDFEKSLVYPIDKTTKE